jgi:hypothetical protein
MDPIPYRTIRTKPTKNVTTPSGVRRREDVTSTMYREMKLWQKILLFRSRIDQSGKSFQNEPCKFGANPKARAPPLRV